MLFLVSGEWIEVSALVSPRDKLELIEQAVLPSLEIWAKWEEDGRIRGGVFAGERAGAFVLEADSSEEVGEILATMPFWGLIKWHVRPLQSVRSTIERERRILEQTRQVATQLGAIASG